MITLSKALKTPAHKHKKYILLIEQSLRYPIQCTQLTTTSGNIGTQQQLSLSMGTWKKVGFFVI